MMSTQVAYDAPLMDADAAVAALRAQPQEVRFEERAPPRLRLVAADGSTTTWTGEATAEARYGGEGEPVFMDVAPQRIDCKHPMMPDYKCLRVCENSSDDSGGRTPPGDREALYGEKNGSREGREKQ